MKRPFVWGLMALFFMPVIAVAVLSMTKGFEVKELPVLNQLPEFELTERSGNLVSLESMKGKVWVAGFVFTSCHSQCPLINKQMQKVQRALRFKERFRLVSISVDPQRDSAEKLRNYALRLEADPYKWLFLTGEQEEINTLSQKGFMLSSAQPNGGDALHSSKLVLVDHFGRIRSYYEANDEEVTKLIKDAKKLIRQAF